MNECAVALSPASCHPGEEWRKVTSGGGDAPSRPAPAMFWLCGLGTSCFTAPGPTLSKDRGFCEPSLLCLHCFPTASVAAKETRIHRVWVCWHPPPDFPLTLTASAAFPGVGGLRLSSRRQGARALTQPSGLTSGRQFLHEGGPPLGPSGHSWNCTFVRAWPGLTQFSEGLLWLLFSRRQHLLWPCCWGRGCKYGAHTGTTSADGRPVSSCLPSVLPFEVSGALCRAENAGVRSEAAGSGGSGRDGGRRRQKSHWRAGAWQPSSAVFPMREVWKGFS